MDRGDYLQRLDNELLSIKRQGLWKGERTIDSRQNAKVTVLDNSNRRNSQGPDGTRTEVLNMCANNYLGLSSHPDVIAAAKKGMDDYGYGLSSVRFICGTQNLHLKLEQELTLFFRKADTILFSSCFDANAGLFETLLTSRDAIISDTLNHASIIDGVRLCKAKRFRYANNDATALRSACEQAREAINNSNNNGTKKGSAAAADDVGGTIFIVTDGVFSMDGVIANLDKVCDIADEFNAFVVVDDSHGVGVLGAEGRGACEVRGVLDRVDIITGTLGKALGGGSGGFVTSGHKGVIDLLRQRARPYLFSNSIPPATAAASLKVLDMMKDSGALRHQLADNARYFREQMQLAGFKMYGAGHPIIPVRCETDALAGKLAEGLWRRGVFAVSFSYPVVPRGKARVRVQVSAVHTRAQLDFAVRAFVSTALELGMLKELPTKTNKPKSKL